LIGLNDKNEKKIFKIGLKCCTINLASKK
jgi:hypothetical protein